MSEEGDIAGVLLQEQLFALFKQQLKKDWEGAGLAGDFAESLPLGYQALIAAVEAELRRLSKLSGTALSALLYRIDINEQQLHRAQVKARQVSFEKILAELIIKRVLQKVVLKKKFGTL